MPSICGSLLFAAVIAAACSSGASSDRLRSVETSKVVDTATKERPSQHAVLNPDEIAELKNYAEAYQPRSGREVIPSPPVVPEKISQIITKAAAANSREHEKFVMLIFVRIARFHRESFKQTYELGRTNPLTIEFYRLIGRDDFERRERNGSDLAEAHIEKNPELQQYNLIEAEMQRITKMAARIAND